MANDIVLYFSGRNAFSGVELIPNHHERGDDILNELSRLGGLNPIALRGWGGTGGSMQVITPAIRYIIRNAPSDKLIIYGFSAGGMDAMALCRNLFRLREARDLVDLLVTVDATAGVGGGHPGVDAFNVRVSPNVAVNLNFWTHKTTTMGDSHGAEHIKDSEKTIMLNRHMKDADHENIRLKSKSKCIEAIRNVLNGKPVETAAL